MKIERSGSTAFHGIRFIEIDNPDIEYDVEKGKLVLKKNSVRDFTSRSHHDYEISMSLEEVASLIKVIGEELIENCPEEIIKALSPNLRQLHRIVNTCIYGNFACESQANESVGSTSPETDLKIVTEVAA